MQKNKPGQGTQQRETTHPEILSPYLLSGLKIGDLNHTFGAVEAVMQKHPDLKNLFQIFEFIERKGNT